MLKSTVNLLLASLPILAYAEDTADCCPLLPPEPVESCQLPVGYFYPAQFTFGNCCAVYTFGGEFIYWKFQIDDAPVDATIWQFGTTGVLTQQLVAHSQGYRPGFKIAAGIGLPQFDNWNIDAEYTWFYNTTKKRFNAPQNGFVFPKLVPALFPLASTSLETKQKMHLNYFHTTIGRAFYLSERLIVKPAVGVRVWWASFELDLFFNVINGTLGTQFTKQGWWGVGPYLTADIKGLLWCGTYLYGKAGLYPTYSRSNKYRVSTNYPAVVSPLGPFPGLVNTQTNRSQPWVTQLFYEGSIGLGWGTYLCDCSYHMDFSVGYDMMTNYIIVVDLSSGLPLRTFAYQGLSVKAQFDF